MHSLATGGYTWRMSEQETPKMPEPDAQQQWVQANNESLKKWADSVGRLQQGVKPAAAGLGPSK